MLCAGIANGSALFEISLLNFKRRKPCFEILLLNFSPRASRLNLKRKSHKIYGSRTEACRVITPLPQKFSAPRRGAILRRALLTTALYSLPRCHFGGAIIQRAAASSLRYASLLRRYLRYPLPSFGSAAMTPHAVAALFCATCAALFSALLFFPRCATLEFYLKFKSASMPREI